MATSPPGRLRPHLAAAAAAAAGAGGASRWRVASCSYPEDGDPVDGLRVRGRGHPHLGDSDGDLEAFTMAGRGGAASPYMYITRTRVTISLVSSATCTDLHHISSIAEPNGIQDTYGI
ncbi:hypothetical protein E2C01_041370 [Portunus trituberculatus]|uniref:Uncharacterized protein n=1 Tax=Portunus trituberculatus TaxID=210409 RepID=A0A5B7FRQ9_PORTR|nr:hypothetical protein [Portunus trituberculatus]